MCKEKYYDDNGVELLPGDVLSTGHSYFVFVKKHSFSGFYNDDKGSWWTKAIFYARPPAKQKYVRSRKEVAQILLDDGYEPDMSGYWSKDCKDTTLYLKETKFTDCGKKLSDCQFGWDEKFLIER